MRRFLLPLLILLATAPALAASDLANVTVMTYDPGHGTQVEYYDAAGGTYLWYPGNKVVLPGRWEYQRGKDGSVLLCFIYGPNTYNPITGSKGAEWECGRLDQHNTFVVDQKKGDVFGLAGRRAVPFVLTPKRTTIAALRKGALAAATPPVTPSAPAAVPVAPSVPAGVTNPDCAAILANANTSRTAKIQAAILYYHGTRMGKACVKVDYLKAFALLREAGDSRTFASLLRDLRQKAEAGHPLAVAALPRIDVSPIP